MPNARPTQSTVAAEGVQDLLKMLPSTLLQEHGCSNEAMEAVNAVLDKLPAMLQKAKEDREKEEAIIQEKLQGAEMEDETGMVAEGGLGAGLGDAGGDPWLERLQRGAEGGNAEVADACRLVLVGLDPVGGGRSKPY